MLAYLSIGSNLGDRLGHLADAVRELDATDGIRVVDRAPVYETEPVGVPDAFRSMSYYNSALLVETTLSADDFSTAVHAAETRLGRTRDGVRNSPRVIDIDIIAFGGLRSARADLRLPHPEAASRRFVLQPLSDLDPNLVLPGQTLTVSALLAGLPPTPAVALAREQWAGQRPFPA